MVELKLDNLGIFLESIWMFQKKVLNLPKV